MNRKEIKDCISKCPVIIAVLNADTYELALHSNYEIVFLLDACLSNLNDKVNRLLDKGKKVFVHIDMVAGLNGTNAVVDYLADTFQGKVGIITTKAQLIKRANKRNIRSIYRGFIVDSKSKHNFILSLSEGIHPDAVEVLPAFVTKAIEEINEMYPNLTVIAGGLVTERKEAYQILNCGASAISTSCLDLLEE